MYELVFGSGQRSGIKPGQCQMGSARICHISKRSSLIWVFPNIGGKPPKMDG